MAVSKKRKKKSAPKKSTRTHVCEWGTCTDRDVALSALQKVQAGNRGEAVSLSVPEMEFVFGIPLLGITDYLSKEMMAEELNCSVPEVESALQELKDKGTISPHSGENHLAFVDSSRPVLDPSPMAVFLKDFE